MITTVSVTYWKLRPWVPPSPTVSTSLVHCKSDISTFSSFLIKGLFSPACLIFLILLDRDEVMILPGISLDLVLTQYLSQIMLSEANDNTNVSSHKDILQKMEIFLTDEETERRRPGNRQKEIERLRLLFEFLIAHNGWSCTWAKPGVRQLM